MPETMFEGAEPNQPIPPEPETKTEATQKPPLNAFAEHQANAAREAFQAFQALIPPDFRTHSRAARHEFLTSFKVLLDGVTEAVDREMAKARASAAAAEAAAAKKADSAATGDDKPPYTGKSKVKVEVL